MDENPVMKLLAVSMTIHCPLDCCSEVNALMYEPGDCPDHVTSLTSCRAYQGLRRRRIRNIQAAAGKTVMATPIDRSSNVNISKVNTAISEVIAEIESIATIKQEEFAQAEIFAEK